MNLGHLDFQNSCHALQGIFTTGPYILFAYFESCLIERKCLISRHWTRRKLSIVKAFYALNSNTIYSCSHIAAGVSTNSLKNCNMHLFHHLVIPPSSLHYRCLKSEISILVSWKYSTTSIVRRIPESVRSVIRGSGWAFIEKLGCMVKIWLPIIISISSSPEDFISVMWLFLILNVQTS